jgi:uncharacterized protein (TIGR02246 family)
MCRRCIPLLVVSLAMSGPVAAQTAQVQDDAEVIAIFESLAKAYNAADAKAIGELWTEKGELIDEDEDERIQGREAIVAAYAKNFDKNNPARLEIDVDKIRRVTADVVSVEGNSRLIPAKGDIDRNVFVAILVRDGKQWRFDQIREKDAPASETNPDRLAELAWMNGSWQYVKGTTEISLECREVANGNFRSHKFRVLDNGEVTHEGTQIIGWDPVKKQIRSWVFSSDGSFGDGLWESRDKRWSIHVNGYLPDGRRTSSTQIITAKDADHFTWHVVDRTVEARVLPNLDEVTMTRTPRKEK